MISIFAVRVAVTVSGVMSAFNTGISKSILFSLLTLLICELFSGLLIVIEVPVRVAMGIVPVVCLSNI